MEFYVSLLVYSALFGLGVFLVILWRSLKMPKKRGICITYGSGIEVTWFCKVVNYVGTVYMEWFGRYIVYFDNKSWERILDIPGEVELLKGDWGGGCRGAMSTVSSDFLVKENQEILRLFANAMNQEHQIFCPLGRIMLQYAKKQDFKNRRNFLEYCKKYPEVLDQRALDSNNGMIVIVGMHRTGSTLLQNLLAQDPKSRTLRAWEMMKAPPPAANKRMITDDPRMHQFVNELKILEAFCPGSHAALNQVHHFHPKEPEEDCLLLNQLGFTWWWLWWMDNREWNEFMCGCTELQAYGMRYLHMCMKVLEQYTKPESHWITKNPNHLQYLRSLMEEFPNANVVITHRHPKSVIPSWSKILIYAHHQLIHNDAIDADRIRALTPEGLGQSVHEHFTHAIRRFLEDRAYLESKEPEMVKNQFFDISFSRLMKEPINVVREIYDQFGYEFTAEFEEKLNEYLASRPKTGVKYTLEEIGLSEETVSDSFREYIDQYEQYF